MWEVIQTLMEMKIGIAGLLCRYHAMLLQVQTTEYTCQFALQMCDLLVVLVEPVKSAATPADA